MQSLDPEIPDEIALLNPIHEISPPFISTFNLGDSGWQEWCHFLHNIDGTKTKCNHYGNALKTGVGSTKGLNTDMKTKHNAILAPQVIEESAPTPAKKVKQQTIVFEGKPV